MTTTLLQLVAIAAGALVAAGGWLWAKDQYVLGALIVAIGAATLGIIYAMLLSVIRDIAAKMLDDR